MIAFTQPALFELDGPQPEQLSIEDVRPELVIVIPCSGEKKPGIFGDDGFVMTAAERYTGSFHRYARHHAEQLGARILVLSAAYGLIPLDWPTPDYEKKITDLDSIVATPGKIRHQAERRGLLDPWTTVVSLCPAAYSAELVRAVPNALLPLAGSRGIGEQRGRIARLATYLDHNGRTTT